VKAGIALPFEDGPGRGWLPDGSRMTWLNAPPGRKADRLPVRAAEHNAAFPSGGKQEVSETCTIVTTLLDYEQAPADPVRDAYLSAGRTAARWHAGHSWNNGPRQPGGLLLAIAELARAEQTSELPMPRSGESNLPLGDLDPEVLERLAAEMIKRQPNIGAHFYGRRGQKQHALDVLEREAVDSNSVYQVRRYNVQTPDKITSAMTECADPEPPKKGPNKGIKPARRFAARRYVLFTSAEFEIETALQERLEELQRDYANDLVIEV
jgi:hypothetical protein